MFIGDGELW